MASLKNCIDWNTSAVALTLAGRTDEAISTIKKSLKVLETLFNASKQNSDLSSSASQQRQQARNQSPIVSVPVPVSISDDNSPSNLFTFYPRMFRISSDANDLSISKILVVLLYNLAVASHMDTISEDTPNPQQLKKVLELYETAMRVAHTSWTTKDAEQFLCVLLALTNNVGHIHSHMLNFQQTRESLSLQMHLLARATEENPLALEDYEVFFESVCVFLDGHDLCLAPAA
jgi:hypothetical protein